MNKTEIHIYKEVHGSYIAFQDRDEAGRVLASKLGLKTEQSCLVLGLPRGGIPVGEPISEELGCPLEPILARKLPIPESPEMGFGAVAIDGSIILNDKVVNTFAITRPEIERVAAEVREEVRRRAAVYSGEERVPNLCGMRVYMVDDGLATGYSMMAAAEMVRKGVPDRLILCVPVSPMNSITVVGPYFDEIHCLIAQQASPFAVASFYRDFHDLSDDEVIAILRRRRTENEGSTLI